jgi:hypothetical protein
MLALAGPSGFSLMTYDYSAGPGAPGPNGPLKWQQENVEDIMEDDNRGWMLYWCIGVCTASLTVTLQAVVQL